MRKLVAVVALLLAGCGVEASDQVKYENDVREGEAFVRDACRFVADNGEVVTASDVRVCVMSDEVEHVECHNGVDVVAFIERDGGLMALAPGKRPRVIDRATMDYPLAWCP